MKKLMTAPVVPADEDGAFWTISDVEENVLSIEIPAPEDPYDWREHLRIIAKQKKWWLRKSHLKDVRSMMKFLIKKRFFTNSEGLIILDEWEGAFHLPPGSVVIGREEGRVPFLAIWEEYC